VQNIIKLGVAVHELSWSQRKKNSDDNNTVRRYRADSNDAEEDEIIKPCPRLSTVRG